MSTPRVVRCGQDRHCVADGDLAGLDAPHVASIVVQRRICRPTRPADVLNRKTEGFITLLAVGDRSSFEDFEQGRPNVPVEIVARLNNHVAVKRRHRYKANVADAGPAREVEETGADALEYGRIVRDEIHLVHRHHGDEAAVGGGVGVHGTMLPSFV